MPVTTLRVELLAHTPDALSLIYAAFRQCYHAVIRLHFKRLHFSIEFNKNFHFVLVFNTVIDISYLNIILNIKIYLFTI